MQDINPEAKASISYWSDSDIRRNSNIAQNHIDLDVSKNGDDPSLRLISDLDQSRTESILDSLAEEVILHPNETPKPKKKKQRVRSLDVFR